MVLLYYYYLPALYYVLCTFLYLLRELNESTRARKRAELVFRLVKITSRAELARYLNEPE
jgi:hypothetical protein